MATNETITEQPRRPEPHDSIHFEHSDISARGVLIAGISLIVGVWIVTGLMWFYFSFLRHHRAATSPPPLPIEAHGNPLPPEPRLQSSPPNDLKAMRSSEAWQLNHYFWIDRAKGTVAIPIERAMGIVAQKGIPPQQAPAGLALSQPQAGSRETGLEGTVEPEPR